MQRAILYLIVAALVWLTLASAAAAQVAVGPGYVRAPFVGVEWGPRGTHVSAPFVNLYVPRRYCPDERSFRSELAAATRELHQALGRFDTAAQWREYFMLSPGMALSADELAEGSQPDPALLEQARLNFAAISNDDQYPMISRLPAFRESHTLLSQYLIYLRNRRTPEELPPAKPAP